LRQEIIVFCSWLWIY